MAAESRAATGPAQGLLRALHTVKGSARMAGAMRLGQHTHALETQIENMLHAGTSSPAAFDELLANYDQAMLLFEQLQQPVAASAGAAQPGARRRARQPAPEDGQAARTPLVRVRADILDRLVNQAGEVSITRSRLENEVGTLKGRCTISRTTWPACAASCARSRCRPSRRSRRACRSPASANSTRSNSTASRACRN